MCCLVKIVTPLSTSSHVIAAAAASHLLLTSSGKQKAERGGGWQSTGYSPAAGLPRPDSEYPQCHWVLLRCSLRAPCLPSLLAVFPSFSATSTQLHFRAVSQKKAAVKGSWPDLLVVSAKCFNVQQAHLQQTQAKVKQQADRCQSLGWEDLGPSTELAWAGGWDVVGGGFRGQM